MASPLGPAGAQTRPSEYAPIHTNEWWTGLWTNRNPMRDAATPYLYQKFYSAARYESMLDGSNVEITPRLTPARRAGSSVYNSQTFSAINDFYAFRTFNTTTFAEGIRVIADTATDVYDATGPSTKTSLLTKATGAAQTSFQSLGNTLYMADGIDQKKYLYFPTRTPTTLYYSGQSTLDPNGNIQRVTSVQWAAGTPGAQGVVATVSLTANVVTIGFVGTPWTSEQIQNLPGTLANFGFFLTAGFLTSTSAPIISVYNTIATGGSPNMFLTAPFVHADYPNTADIGSMAFADSFGVNSSGPVVWNAVRGGTSTDGVLTWTNEGPSVIDWQPISPQTAPSVANTLNSAQSSWAASTYFWPSLIIQDSNNNLQLLTTAGTTAVAVPTWAAGVGATTADGSAVWTNKGQAAWQANHTYASGAYIGVTFSVTFPIYGSSGFKGAGRGEGNDSGGSIIIGYRTVTYSNFFSTVNGGVSGPSQPTWAAGSGTQVQDNTVLWVGKGTKITRTVSATSSTNISNSVAVSLLTQVVDAAGFAQNVSIAGLSGAAPPTWNETSGGATIDNQITWINAGPVGVANTGAWVYGYAFKNSVTGGVSSSSGKSSPVILNLNSYITVSGQGDPNYLTDGVDTIQIYRSVQGQTALFWLIDIPAPALGGAWTYQDSTPDPPTIGSILNEFVSADVVGNNSPPPTGATGLTYYLSRMWCIVGEFVYYSSAPQGSVGVNTDNWNLNDNFQMPSVVTKLWASTSGILFFTNQGIYLSSGVDGNGRPNQPVPLPLEDIGLLSPNCFAVNGSVPLLFTGDRQFISLDPAAGVSRAGFPIEDQLALFDPTSSYVTWHTSGSDQGAYIADGSTGWFRVNLTPAPESGGYTWSPRATIVGGCKCIKSIETSPGVRNLLIGTATTGPILKRDFSTHQDNGSNYAAFFTVGNIVLSQPGQAAEVEFITTECLKNGSNVAVSILCDEIAASGPQGFELLTGDSTNDPPWATPSNTLFSTRWYLGPTRQPSWMRHLQITFTWPTENAANEMLTYTMYAALRNDNA